MPALFAADRIGFTERWLIAEHLAGTSREDAAAGGDHRNGREAFLSLGCAACHHVPDLTRAEQPDFDRFPLVGLGDRMKEGDLAAFLGNPHGRYPDGRMPRLPVPPNTARDIAAYLLLWSKPSEEVLVQPPSVEEIGAVLRRLRARKPAAAAGALLKEKRCGVCHPGLGATQPANVPIKADHGCLSGKTMPRFALDAAIRKAIAAYRGIAGREKHPSPFESRQRLIERSGCLRCHQRDSDRPPPLEQIGSTLGGARLQNLPFQRTPRLSYPHQKYHRAYLVAGRARRRIRAAARPVTPTGCRRLATTPRQSCRPWPRATANCPPGRNPATRRRTIRGSPPWPGRVSSVSGVRLRLLPRLERADALVPGPGRDRRRN